MGGNADTADLHARMHAAPQRDGRAASTTPALADRFSQVRLWTSVLRRNAACPVRRSLACLPIALGNFT